ncbi:MAG: hypothetical protein ACE5KX_02900 [Acidimicrobiia bacterium]
MAGTKTESSWRRSRLRIGGAAVAALLALALGACGSTGDSAQPPAVSAPADEATASEVAEARPVDAEAVLADALDATGDSYEFSATVTVEGDSFATVTGRVDGAFSQFLVEVGGIEVEYVLGSEERWFREGGNSWVALEATAPVTTPLTFLADPLRVELLDGGVDGAAVIVGTYLGAALGFFDTDEVQVEVVVADGRLGTVEYEAGVGDKLAVVLTEFTKVGDVTPVTIPVMASLS